MKFELILFAFLIVGGAITSEFEDFPRFLILKKILGNASTTQNGEF